MFGLTEALNSIFSGEVIGLGLSAVWPFLLGLVLVLLAVASVGPSVSSEVSAESRPQ